MVKHIVFFKKKNTDEGTSTENAKKLKQILESLPNKIDNIIDCEVGINISENPIAMDVVLFSTFENLDELDNYRNHPLVYNHFFNYLLEANNFNGYRCVFDMWPYDDTESYASSGVYPLVNNLYQTC